MTAGMPDAGPAAPSSRAAGLATNLAAVENRITEACTVAGRPRADVTLIAVTKGCPAGDVRTLAALGVADVGESRDQEARIKVSEVEDVALRWHFLGQLQRNKVRSVASYAWMIHTVDRPELIHALSDAARRGTAVGGLLVQVALDRPRDPARGGALPSQVPELAHRMAAAGLTVAGVMAVAPRSGDPRAAFDELVAVSARLRSDHPHATVISAGMSNDLAAAVAAGATHLRVGTAILGNRPQLR